MNTKQTMDTTFCPHCGKEGLFDARYCSTCGISLRHTSRRVVQKHQITPFSFLPLLFHAFGNISVRDIGGMLTSVWRIITAPFTYVQQEEEGKLTPMFTMLAIATIAGVIKVAQDPLYAPFLPVADGEHRLLYMALRLGAYSVIALFFAVGSFFTALFWYYVLGIQIDRDQFVRAMTSVFCVFAFIFDAASPLWMPFVQNGTIPWLLPDTIRTLIITVYSWIVGTGITRSIEHRKESPNGRNSE